MALEPRRFFEMVDVEEEEGELDIEVDVETVVEDAAVAIWAAVCVAEFKEFSDFLIHNLIPVLFSLI